MSKAADTNGVVYHSSACRCIDISLFAFAQVVKELCPELEVVNAFSCELNETKAQYLRDVAHTAHGEGAVGSCIFKNICDE